ncbi:MAG: hypothetical protein QOI78_4909, partial [Actinomycetota bacterium]|nr:hypothetical protein [Actinomycetota bacterium]
MPRRPLLSRSAGCGSTAGARVETPTGGSPVSPQQVSTRVIWPLKLSAVSLRIERMFEGVGSVPPPAGPAAVLSEAESAYYDRVIALADMPSDRDLDPADGEEWSAADDARIEALAPADDVWLDGPRDPGVVVAEAETAPIT